MNKKAIQAALDEAKRLASQSLVPHYYMDPLIGLLEHALAETEWRRMASAPYDGTPILIKYLEHHTNKNHHFVGRYITSRYGKGRSHSMCWASDFSGDWFGEFDTMIGWQPLSEEVQQ